MICIEADALDLHRCLARLTSPITQPRHLTLRAEDLTQVSSLLEYLHPTRLESLTINCTHIDAPPAYALSQLFRAIRDFCSPGMFNNFRVDHWEMDDDIIYSASILQDLFVFRNMNEFKVQYSFALEDNIVKELGHAWPQLRSLSLRSGQRSHITLEGLLELVAGCPSCPASWNLTSMSPNMFCKP
jgi:hypothetical protein